ncbi:MAG: amino acid carrier protein [Clostridia bacterium]
MLHQISLALWGIPTVIIIGFFGIYFTVKSRFYQFRGFSDMKKSLKSAFKKSDAAISPFAAISTALGGTIGIGSISGVGLSLAVGGAGSIFWMWICGFFSMMIKYAEVYSAVKNRKRVGNIYVGGAMYSLADSQKKVAAYIFAFMCIFASFGVGNLTQSAAIGDIMSDIGISRIITGVLLAAIFAISVFGGQIRIAKISESVVPIAGAVYLLLVFYIIIAFIPCVPSVFAKIIKEAFGLTQIGGGIAGSAVSLALRTGITRGIFSNEAGMGSSPIAHAAAENALPHTQGILGIAEIAVDTFVFSTLTAIALLCVGTTDVFDMFSGVFGGFGRAVLPLLLVIFAFASSISWCYYSESCINFIFKKNAKVAAVFYRFAAVLFICIGATIDMRSIWDVADILNALMIFPNLYNLFLKRKEITECFGTQKV